VERGAEHEGIGDLGAEVAAEEHHGLARLGEDAPEVLAGGGDLRADRSAEQRPQARDQQ
jgi:hypothetical protein